MIISNIEKFIKGSNIKVKVKCDFNIVDSCKGKYEIPYCAAIQNIENNNKICCKSCSISLINKKRFKNHSYKTKQEEIEYQREYYKKNKIRKKLYAKEHQQKSTDRKRKRYQTEPNFRIADNLRSRIGRALKNNQKAGSAVKDLGCTIKEFKIYLEGQFIDGMSWDNQGEWHIDHIIPLSSFDLTDREQFLKACHYTNMQPLWAIDNLRKGSK